ncbi:MAG TPA: DUF4156 domain-containing protein [Stenotrophomonas sp.]|uniref:DUF4156 domain-containing protein n=1 Tax=unclassified Stenotrophomonas TaxID=196198 RepID=UPI000DE6E6F4|nr:MULTISPECIES: DUF4156 domain-containing protein [unclassified Stenotrophomonas]PWB23160.1 DUF4156 domain-containing protein [Stenotrophomonas sp. SPM]HCR35146.1 DUF4156 domain-containing protein [Stenotrophomonas sp.]
MHHRLAVLAALALLLSGCASTRLHGDATLVRLTHEEPKGCQFLGDITGSQGNFLTGSYTSNKNLESGARNDLKNQAAARGGNVIYLLTNRAGVTGRQGGGQAQTNVTLSGNVYRCP